MANQADGTIYVDTEIDAEGFRAGSAELERAIKSLSTSVNNLGPLFQKALAGNEKAVQSFQSKAAALQETISQLEAKMQALGTKAVPTEQYSKVSADIAKLEARFDSLMDKQDKMLALGVDQESQSWKSLQYDIETCGQKIRELTAEKERMEQSGKAFQLGSETAQYQRMAQQLEAARKKLSDMQVRLSESNTESSHLAENAKKAATHIGSAAKNASSKLLFGLRQAASTMWRMATHGRSANRQFDGLIAQAKRFALGLLGAEGIFTLLRKVTNDYMAQNQQLSATLSSCWSGIGNILGPIITRLVNLVAAAVSYVTQFLSLFGIYGKTATKAIDSAGGAASGAAKELKRELASFDELNILSDNGSGGGGGGGGLDLGNDPADVELPDWAKLMAEQIKAGNWGAAGTILAGAFNSWIDNFDWNIWGARLGKGIQNGISFALGFIRNTHWEGLGGGFAGFLNSAIENIDPKDFGALLASKLRIMVDMAYGFVTTFRWGNFGDWLGDIVNGWFAEIDWVKAAKTFSGLIRGALESAVHLLETTDWEEIGEDIGEFFENIEWDGIFEDVAKVVTEALGALTDAFVGFWNSLSDDGKVKAAIGASAITMAKLSKSNIRSELKKKIGGTISIATGLELLINNINAVNDGKYKNASLASAAETAVSGALVGGDLIALGASGFILSVAITLAFAITDIAANWEEITAMWEKTLSGIKNLFTGNVDGFWQDISDAFLSWMGADSLSIELQKFLVNAIFGDGKWEAAQEALENGATFGDLGEIIINSLKSGIAKALIGIGDWVSWLPQSREAASQ